MVGGLGGCFYVFGVKGNVVIEVLVVYLVVLGYCIDLDMVVIVCVVDMVCNFRSV